jgi:hypothetical protein
MPPGPMNVKYPYYRITPDKLQLFKAQMKDKSNNVTGKVYLNIHLFFHTIRSGFRALRFISGAFMLQTEQN